MHWCTGLTEGSQESDPCGQNEMQVEQDTQVNFGHVQKHPHNLGHLSTFSLLSIAKLYHL